MKHQKVLDLLNEPNKSQLMTLTSQIIYNTEVLKSNPCDCNHQRRI